MLNGKVIGIAAGFAVGSSLAYAAPAPLPVTAGLALQLDASDGFTGSTWTDLSGNGHNASVYLGAPTVGTDMTSGLPTAVFGGNAEMQISGQVITSQQFTIIAVASDTSAPGDTSNREIFSDWEYSDAYTVFFGTTGYFGGNMVRFGDQFVPAGNVSSPTQPFVLAAVSGATDAYVAQGNGSSISTIGDRGSPMPTLNLTDGYFIGGQANFYGHEFWQGTISEILVYNRALSSSELAAVDSYLGQEWLGDAPTAVPLPGTVSLMGAGVAALAVIRRRTV